MRFDLSNSVMAREIPTHSELAENKNDDVEFVFAGRCHDGTHYKLVSYKSLFNGTNRSYFDYDGPAGKGVVRSETEPRVMAVRVCRKNAEILNENYWE